MDLRSHTSSSGTLTDSAGGTHLLNMAAWSRRNYRLGRGRDAEEDFMGHDCKAK